MNLCSPLGFRADLFTLPSLEKGFACFFYPTASSALGRTIIQVDENFVSAVWALQDNAQTKEA